MTEPPARSGSGSRARRLAALAAVLAAVLAASWPALRGDSLPGGAPQRAWLAGDELGRWRPLFDGALDLGVALGGGSAVGLRAIALVVHLAATWIVFRLSVRLAGSDRVAAFAALLFGLHPVHAETLARTDALSIALAAPFGLAALDAFLRWRDAGSRGVPIAPAVLLALALLCDEIAIAVLPMAVAIDLGRRDPDATGDLGAQLRPAARAYLPWIAACAAIYAARVSVFGDLGAGFDRAALNYGVPSARLAWLRVEILGGAVGSLAWPFGAPLFKPFVPEPETFAAATLAPLGWLAAWIAAAWLAIRRRARPEIAALLLVPAAALPVALRLRALGESPLADRFLVLAALGFAATIALAAERFLPRILATAALLVVALALGVESYRRAASWRDGVSVLETTAAAAPRSPAARWRLGQGQLERYRSERRPADLRDACESFQDALDLLADAQTGDGAIFATRWDHVQANLGLAWCLWYEAEIDPFHDYELPLTIFQQVADRYPDVAEAWIGLGIAQGTLGRLDDAQTSLSTAIALDRGSAEAHHNLGQIFVRRGDWAAAAREFEAASSLRPASSSSEARLDDFLWLARARAQAGDVAHAREILDRAREAHPESAAPLVVLGNLAAAGGDTESALRLAREALALDPDDGEALVLLGKLHAAHDDTEQATSAFVRAAQLLPQSFEAHYNAASLLLAARGVGSALPFLVRAYALRPPGADGERLHATLAGIEGLDADTLLALAEADVARRDAQGALDWLARVFQDGSAFARGHLLAGRLLRDEGDLEGAAAEWRLACDQDPASFDAHLRLAQVLTELGRGDEARTWLELAAALRGPGTLGEARAIAVDAVRRQIETPKGE